MKTSGALTFLKELPKRFTEIGAVMPSSPSLARSMVRPIKKATAPLRILEVGPGTGAITQHILKLMGPTDSLLVCEINRVFLNELKQRLTKNSKYRAHRSRVKFFLGPVQDLKKRRLTGKFDVIVSSLPFSNFSPETVEEILSLYRELLAPDGTLTFFEYLGMRRLGALLHSDRERERILAVDRVVKEWRSRCKCSGRIRTDVTLLNIPPAITLELRYGGAAQERPALLRLIDSLRGEFALQEARLELVFSRRNKRILRRPRSLS